MQDYGAKLVLLLPTCEQRSIRDSALIIEMFRQAMEGLALWRVSSWPSLTGTPIVDPLNLCCILQEVTPDRPLVDLVGNLSPGLNLWTGSGGETKGLNYKHDFKT